MTVIYVSWLLAICICVFHWLQVMKGLRYLRDNHKVIHRGKTPCMSMMSELGSGGSCSISSADVCRICRLAQ